MKEGKVCYYELLREEENFCREEQNAVLSELLSTNRTSLSLLRRAGLALTGLEVSGKRTGRGGRIVIEFSIDRGVGKHNTSNTSNSNSNTNNCCFKAGEPVKLVVNGQLLQSTIGTVERPVTEEKICVSLQSEGEDFDILLSSSRVSLVKVMDNSGNFEKMRRNLDELSKGTRDLLKELRGFVFEGESDVYDSGDNTTVVDSETKETKDTFGSSDTKYTAASLNEEQMEAVERSFRMFSSMRENMFLLHGPPGTGKTSTLVAIIQRLLSQTDKKILVCGPSNLSVDNITEKLIEGCGSKTGKIVRLGHPSRVLESCQEVTLDHLQETSDMGQLLKDVQGEIDELVRVALPRCRSREERRVIYAELKELRSERKKREFLLSGQVLKAARVVLCTLSTASGGKLKDFLFDVSIVDEAGQALLPEVLIAPLRAKKLLLAGDHFQLPATVQNCAVKGKLEVSLFERLLSGKGNSLMLKQQYRMNSQIMAWSNQKFYSNQLRAHPSVANRKLEFSSSDGLSDSLIFYDTCGFDLWETNEGESSLKSNLIKSADESKFNEGEAKVAISHYQQLCQAGLNSCHVAMISPYAAQVSLLRSQLSELSPEKIPEVNSIDGFQGREKDVVILSLVRSNCDGIVGFLDEMRRINVAMTRAKKQLVVIGDSETLSRNLLLKELVEFLNENATIQFPSF